MRGLEVYFHIRDNFMSATRCNVWSNGVGREGEKSEIDSDPQQYCHQGVAEVWRARKHTETQRDISDQVILPPSHSELLHHRLWSVN